VHAAASGLASPHGDSFEFDQVTVMQRRNRHHRARRTVIPKNLSIEIALNAAQYSTPLPNFPPIRILTNNQISAGRSATDPEPTTACHR
jgi:hypothetical protein